MIKLYRNDNSEYGPFLSIHAAKKYAENISDTVVTWETLTGSDHIGKLGQIPYFRIIDHEQL